MACRGAFPPPPLYQASPGSSVTVTYTITNNEATAITIHGVEAVSKHDDEAEDSVPFVSGPSFPVSLNASQALTLQAAHALPSAYLKAKGIYAVKVTVRYKRCVCLSQGGTRGARGCPNGTRRGPTAVDIQPTAVNV